MLDYDPDKQLCWRVLFFFDGSQASHHYSHMPERLGDCWQITATDGSGDYELVKNGPSQKNMESFLASFLCEVNETIKPLCTPKMKRFRRGNFPKLN